MTLQPTTPPIDAQSLLNTAQQLRQEIGEAHHDRLMEAIFTDAARIADSSVVRHGNNHRQFDQTLDRLLTHRIFGFIVMGLLLLAVFWITIMGANVPSSILGSFLLSTVYDVLHQGADALNLPWWFSGFWIDGVYLATAWVVAVMLPPMAIFFPIFTLLEDFGYLPRVAFNLDRMFEKVGAHGKQSLTMMMGYGCNAAGVISTRIIDSPRERMIAIITNNFSVCNGRWPTLILIGTIFISATASAGLASLVAAMSVMVIVLIGIGVTLAVSLFLSKTWLKGEASVYSLELPPYRPPQVIRTLYTSMIDRTMIVLWRAIVMAAPAGAVIWLTSNIFIGDESVAGHMVNGLNPLGLLLGLNGVILVAYIVAIPANELVIPTVLMLTLTLGGSTLAKNGVMLELSEAQIQSVLRDTGGWTMLTGINLMLFSLLHNPCSTTLITIWRETHSVRWTVASALIPLSLGFAVCLSTTIFYRLFF